MFALYVIAVTLAVAIILLAFVQLWLVNRYCRIMAQNRTASERHDPEHEVFEPAAAVILCLRGNDPTLYSCLKGLAQQEYSEFHLYAVTDNKNDPSIATLRQVSPEFEREPLLVTMPQIAKNRTLKCSALLTAFEAIESDDFQPEVVALIDSDVNSDPFWLRDLIEPFRDSKVGATTGNRWFEPISDEFGTRMRQVWNAAAVVQMHYFKIAWGGSLAFRASLIQEERFLTPLRTGFCEDTGINQVLSKLNLDLVRVPGLIMSSSESIALKKCVSFITRQNLTARLNHPAWPFVFTHGLSIVFLNVATLIIFVFTFGTGFQFVCMLPLLCLIGFQVLNLRLLGRISTANRFALQARDQPVHEEFSIPRYLISVLLIQFLHAYALLAASFKQLFWWRQIEYRVKSGNNVSMLAYQPFTPPPTEDLSIE